MPLPSGLLFAEKLGSTCAMTSQGAHGEPNLDRFARIVKARRDALKLSQEEANALGGPSDTTFSKIENRTWRPERSVALTLRRLDAGLKWVKGSAERTYYENGDPIPLPGTDKEAAVPDDVVDQHVGSRSDFDLAVELTVLMENASRVAWIALQNAPDHEASAAMDKLDDAVYLAEKLALQLADSGDQFAARRRQVRAEVRVRIENSADADLPSPAQLAEAAGQPVHPDEDWVSGTAGTESWQIARADAERSPDT